MDTWDAFCTIHYFLTGEPIVRLSKHPLTDQLYDWYIDITDCIMDDIR